MAATATTATLTKAAVLEHARKRVVLLFDADPIDGFPERVTVHFVVGSLRWSRSAYFDVRWRASPPLCFECTTYCVSYPMYSSGSGRPRPCLDVHSKPVLSPDDVVDIVRKAILDMDEATLFCDIWTMCDRDLLSDRSAVVAFARGLLALAPGTGPGRTLLLRALAGSDVWDMRLEREEQCQRSAERALEKALVTLTAKGS
jgi:hypothetical protein